MPNIYIYLILKTGSTVRTPSPRARQISWNNMFYSDMDGDGSYKTFSGHQTSVLYASFSPTGDEVVSCSSDGFVKVIFCTVCPLQISISFGL
jgi:WD40 repeat protein